MKKYIIDLLNKDIRAISKMLESDKDYYNGGGNGMGLHQDYWKRRVISNTKKLLFAEKCLNKFISEK